MLGVRDAAEAVGDDVAAVDCDVVDMVVVVVVGVNDDVVGDRVDRGVAVPGVVIWTVSCTDPEGPIPMICVVELWDIHKEECAVGKLA